MQTKIITTLLFCMPCTAFASVRGESVVSEEKKINITVVYDATIAALDEVMNTDVEFVLAVEEKKEAKITLEKGQALQMASAKFSQALNTLAAQCTLGEKMMNEIQAELLELVSGKVSQEELFAKTRSFLDRFGSIILYNNQWMIKIMWLCIKARMLGFFPYFKIISNIAPVYEEAIAALIEVKKLAGQLATAVQRKKEGAVILAKAQALQASVSKLSQLLRTFSVKCGMNNSLVKEGQIELARLVGSSLSKDELAARVETWVKQQRKEA